LLVDFQLASKWQLKRKTNGSESEIIPNGATIYKWTTYTDSLRSEAFFNLDKTYPFASMYQ
jgi:hypothetical protein